jgi:hypothetical protein
MALVARLLLVLVLIFSVTPMASETVELLVHAIEHGDLAHGGAHEESAEDEHGCSTLFHMCGCHASAPTVVVQSRAWTPAAFSHIHRFAPKAPATSAGRGSEAPPLRPPIA